MKTFDSVEDLAKAAGHLAGHFGKAAAHHKAMADQHDGLHKEHTEMAAFHKGMHDALEEGHEQKAFHKRMSEHHAAKAAGHKSMHELHKAHADHSASMAEAYGEEKAAGSRKPTAKVTPAEGTDPENQGGIEGLVASTTQGLVKKSLEMLDTDTTIQDAIRQIVLSNIQKALEGQVRPDGVSLVAGSVPSHLKLVPRAGAQVEKVTIDPELEDMMPA